MDILSGVKVMDPEELVVGREELDVIEKKMEHILSTLEWKVLMSYLDGKSYQEIAESLGRHVKSVDNALQRVKRKLEKYMKSRSDEIDLHMVYRSLGSVNRRLRGVVDDDGMPH